MSANTEQIKLNCTCRAKFKIHAFLQRWSALGQSFPCPLILNTVSRRPYRCFSIASKVFLSLSDCCQGDIDFTKNCILTNFNSHSQSLVRILWRSDKEKITFWAIEKHRYGVQETVSKHLKQQSQKSLGKFTRPSFLLIFEVANRTKAETS